MLATEKGFLDVVRILLEKKASLTNHTDDNMTALHVACYQGHDTIVEFFLVQQDINKIIELQCYNGNTALMIAAEKGHLKIVQALCKKTNNFTLQGNAGTVLNIASHFGKIDVVRFLLSLPEIQQIIDLPDKIFNFTPLIAAAQNGFFNIVEILLLNKANIHYKGKSEVSAYLAACSEGHLNIVQLLLQSGADLADVNNHKSTSLQVSCGNGYYDLAKFLLEQKEIGSLIDQPDKDGFTPLVMSAQGGYFSIVKLLLNKNAMLSWVNDKGVTALYMACQNGHANIVELFLIQNGIEKIIEQTFHDGSTPLLIAVQNGYLPIVKMLVTKGANVNAIAKNNLHVLSIARLHKHADIVEFLQSIFYPPEVISVLSQCNITSDKDNFTSPELALYRSIIRGKSEWVRLLLNVNNLKINTVFIIDDKEFTPLMIASQLGDLDIIKMLIRSGADVAKITARNMNALYIACESGQTAIVKLLLDESNIANVVNQHVQTDFSINRKKYKHDDPSNLGLSPLLIAIIKGFSEIVEMLLASNSDITAPLPIGYSALYVACQKGHTYIVKLLLNQKNIEKIINLGARDGLYKEKVLVHEDALFTPLMISAQNGFFEISEMLLQKGADLTTCSYGNISALYIACQNGNEKIVELFLEQKGIEKIINLPIKDGTTPLMMAAEKGYLKLSKHFVKRLIIPNRKGLS